MSALPYRQPSSAVCIGQDVTDLVAIFEPATQLAIWTRQLPEPFTDQLAKLDRTARSGWRATLLPGADIRLPQCSDTAASGFLEEDLKLLCEIMTTLLEPDRLGVRLEWLDRPMCPRFHVDQVGIRLVCTYLGSGTEWQTDEDAGQVSRGAVALLKGSAWQGNSSGGIRHRSPDPGGKPRLLVAIDALWD